MEPKRLKFKGVGVTELDDGNCRAEVTLAWHAQAGELVGEAVGPGDRQALLRVAAAATVDALEQAVGKKVKLDLLGVRSISAFDAMMVVVSLSGQFDHQSQRLVGSCIIKGQPSRAVALAVLNATNRLLGDNYVYL